MSDHTNDIRTASLAIRQQRQRERASRRRFIFYSTAAILFAVAVVAAVRYLSCPIDGGRGDAVNWDQMRQEGARRILK